MTKDERVKKLVESLTECLAELDQLGAYIAAAQVDSALHALNHQFNLALERSVTE